MYTGSCEKMYKKILKIMFYVRKLKAFVFKLLLSIITISSKNM